MIWLKVIFVALVFSAVAVLALVLVQFNLKRLQIIRAAAAATREQLEEIYRLIEAREADGTNGFVLGRTNEVADDATCAVAIPGGLKDFPWAGMSIAIEVGRDVRFRFLDASVQGTQLLGWKYRPVAVPHKTLKSGKRRNQFAPSQYLKGNEELRQNLKRICRSYPLELLSYLLCAGRESFEFEPFDQGRIGTSAAWIQDPEFQYCDQCNKRMVLILQVPGALLDKKAYNPGTFYLFGCKTHPEKTRMVNQFT